MKIKLQKLIPVFLGITTFFVSSLNAQNADEPLRVPGTNSFCKPKDSNQRTINNNQTPQDGSGTLGNYYSLTKCGLQYTTATQVLGQRFTPAGVAQPATFVLAGMPSGPCITIEKAILYCDASGDGTAITATVNGPLGSANYPMTMIGSGPDKCWGFTGTFSYRADITASVNGNGNYDISGLPTGASGNDVDGATIIAIWSDGSQTYQGTINIDDGCIEISGGNASYNMNYPAICGTPTNGEAFFVIADIQTNPNSWSANGTSCPLTWAWWNYITTPSPYSTGQTTSNYSVSSGGDCYNLMVTGTYFQTTCTACAPSGTITLTSSTTQSTCAGCDGTATANPTPAGAYTYSWAPSGQTTQTATNLCPGVYTVTVTGSCSSATTTITVTSAGTLASTSVQTPITCNGGTGTATVTASGGNGPYTYNWTPSGGNGATATGLTAGTYTCTVTDANGCITTQVITLTQPTAIAGTATSTPTSCTGNTGTATTTASGGTGPYTYSWAPSGGTGATASNLGVGNYTCTITDANGCTQTAITSVTSLNGPTATLQSQQDVSCNGGNSGSATVNPTGGTAPYTYAWSPSGGTAATANGLTSGTYTCTITDAAGCTTTQTVTITQPQVLIITTTGDSVCSGSAGTITAIGNGGVGPYSYLWSNGSTSTTQTVPVTSDSTLTVAISDANGCTTTGSATINLIANPNAEFTSNAVNGSFGLTGGVGQLCFTNTTVGASVWVWSLNGVPSVQQNPCVNVTTADTGLFCATLIVTNTTGCIDSSDVCVTIGESSYSIPNVFTPNADGTNDGFVITNRGMKTLSCEIYNRWGELIYEWNGTAGYWDGKMKNGNEAVDGVYYYTAHLTDFSDKQYEESGFVQLIRGKK